MTASDDQVFELRALGERARAKMGRTHVTSDSGVVAASAIGREAELALLGEFLGGERELAALLLTGGPGIGKTTLWDAGVAAARGRGLTVLVSRPSGAEAQLAFAGLIDLFDGVDLNGLAALPAPQRRALEVALLRAEPAGAPPEPRAITVGALNALRALSIREPLVIAIDDVQLLDAPSADALAFSARRLEGEAVQLLLARRPGRASALERALEPRGLRRVEVGPLSLGATRRLLSDRLGLSLPRRLLRRIFESSLGNPLFALELGRTLDERGPPQVGEDIPVPEDVEDLLGTRVAHLRASSRRLLLAVALSADLRTAQLVKIAGKAAVDEAVDRELLLVAGDRVRPSHPLLAAAAKRRSRASERRALHLELAGVVADEELRALHLALATELPDVELAARVAAAADGAAARGARQEAAELAEHALRLTPLDATERTERLLALAGYLDLAGELQRLTDLLEPELDSLPPGAARVRAWLLLAEGGGVRSLDDLERHLDAALAECGGDPVLRAHVLAKKSDHAAASAVSRISLAEEWALEAQRAAPRAGPEVERLALVALGWARTLRGRPIDDLCERFHAVSDAASNLADSPERVAAQRLVWRGDVQEARATFTRLLSMADERNELIAYALQRLHLCELELRVGNWGEAEALLDEWAGSSEGELLIWPMYERCRALLAAGRGLPEEAERWAAAARARAEASGGGWDVLETRRALGIASLLAHTPERAAESLRPVWEHTQREGVDEPGVFPVAPELVEALVELGDLDGGRAVTARLQELAERQEHPWGLVTVRRCGGLLGLAGGPYDGEAAAELVGAATGYGELGLRFDRARALLSLGRALRRHRKWAAARDALEQAAGAFGELGSHGWTEEARSELSRVGARRPRPSGELTPAERRVAELAAEGLANKEIARALFVSVKTVEVHLSRAYAKVGVRSRAQLARRISVSE